MKTKKLLHLLVALMAMSFVACDAPNQPQDPETEQEQWKTSQVVGLWGFSLEDDEKPYFQWYYEFAEDGTASELLYWDGDTRYYGCYLGSFDLTDSILTFNADKYTVYFYWNEVPRVGYFYQGHMWGDMEILSVEEDKISVIYDNTMAYLHRLSEKPAGMNPEFFEPEKAASVEVLAGAWDQLDYFIIQDNGNFNWWAYDYPELNGMHLLADGTFQDLNWTDGIYYWCTAHLQLPERWGWIWSKENMSWDLSQNTNYNFYCSTFAVVEVDEEGNIVEGTRQDITPSDPKLATYQIVSLTDHYMILFSADQNIYYAFTPGDGSQDNAPKRLTPAMPRNVANLHSGSATPTKLGLKR